MLQKLGDFCGAALPDSLPAKVRVNARANAFVESRLRYINWFANWGSPYERHPFYMGNSANRFSRSLKRALAKAVPACFDLKENARLENEIDDQVGKLYRESNLKTSELIGIDLSKYNY